MKSKYYESSLRKLLIKAKSSEGSYKAVFFKYQIMTKYQIHEAFQKRKNEQKGLNYQVLLVLLFKKRKFRNTTLKKNPIRKKNMDEESKLKSSYATDHHNNHFSHYV